MADATAVSSSTCTQCGSVIAPMMLACPSCASLVHSAELNRLAGEAEQASQAGHISEALGLWRRAIELLPQSSRQYAMVMARIATLSRTLDGDVPPPMAAKQASATNKMKGPLAGLGTMLMIGLSKGKFLLLGLAKLPTLLSMFAAFGVYWTLWGWPFALGFVVCIYIHEMGHVAALRRYGIPASAPMFIPGLGAFVRLKQSPVSVVEDARVGLAGPIWGLGASVACFLVYFATRQPVFAALGQVSATINLFNLIPVWSLDGSRGFRALSNVFRTIVAGVTLAAVFFAHDQTKMFLMIIGGIGAFKSFSKDAPKQGDQSTLITFVGLIITLTILASVDVVGQHHLG